MLHIYYLFESTLIILHEQYRNNAKPYRKIKNIMELCIVKCYRDHILPILQYVRTTYVGHKLVLLSAIGIYLLSQHMHVLRNVMLHFCQILSYLVDMCICTKVCNIYSSVIVCVLLKLSGSNFSIPGIFNYILNKTDRIKLYALLCEINMDYSYVNKTRWHKAV